MAVKKSELYSFLWESCNKLRGGMDASQYKDYVLSLLFVKYVSDKYEGKKNSLIYIPEDGGFKDIVALKGNKEIGDKINKIIANLAEANDLKGVIDVADFNNEDKLGRGKDMQDRLSGLVAIFEDERLDFSKNRADGDDILGDAYEFLMRKFATESGKSKGQFYTPSEVSRVMAKIIGIDKAKSQDQTIYDPTCGSGSLLLKAADEAESGVTIYGQENDNATAALARMNMILHGHPTADIKKDNTLSNPLFKEGEQLKTFNFVVANPPFSQKNWTSGLDLQHDEFERFSGYGIPPTTNGDYAFLLHIVRSLKSNGKGAVILPHGVLFRGNAEGEIRRNLINKGFIKAIIGLPTNLFYGTGIPACIIVLDKENAVNRKGIFMIDASKGFTKDGNKNRLRDRDVHKIVDVYTKRTNILKYSRMVSVEEIEVNEYNLNISRYIDSEETADIQNIEAHLLGGIPNDDIDALQNYWDVYPSLKEILFSENNRDGFSTLLIEQSEVKNVILKHPEFVRYSEKVKIVLDKWKAESTIYLKNIKPGVNPKDVIYHVSENILNVFSSLKLIDHYEVYQHLMTYWYEIMQDDVYMIAADGWKSTPELIPTSLIANQYFLDDLTNINLLESEIDEVTQLKEKMEEEQSGEDDVFEELRNDKGKVLKGNIQKRIKTIKKTPDFIEELQLLESYLLLFNKDSELSNKIKEARQELDRKVTVKYKSLSIEEIKFLVVDQKWMASVTREIEIELENISQHLSVRIIELSERYKNPLPTLEKKIVEIGSKVDEHLKRMGFSW
ncbi:type I restriction-modification system subunit M [Anaerobacillus isosaccharinicus]|uniref:site-specific DNA-methyltransferase (adenine-specific) n=1 Tax=Anaerobacillus isosaccharinicus TaxID=1532552 RepID=A0A1S2L1L0_9BACI|nr:type I restriction-modification system subunit M [Anaerobacillus isosaccharinicus]MBA5584259.1 type I restriction-modification system subunit M [Anaerobacillus isosaccharinicus]QOY37340.1 type I restriction-modification system subunit M [Anaerobacillus isosaccharinicus]